MSRFIFSTQNPGGTTNLYATDGTASGTTDLDMSRFSFAIDQFIAPVEFAGRTFLVGTGAQGQSAYSMVFATDGTLSGTTDTLVTGQGGPDSPDGLWVLGGALLTSGFTKGGVPGLWASADGTSFSEIATGVSTSDLAVAGGVGLFAGVGANSAPDGLWRTDGTAAGTSSITPGGQSLDVGTLMPVAGGRTLFTNQAADGSVSLWVTDGTAAGTHPLGNAALGSNIGQSVSGASVGGRAIFNAVDSAGQIGVWSSDGTSAGTVQIEVSGPSGDMVRTPGGFVPWNNKMLFSTGYTLIVTDGTAAGTIDLGNQPAPDAWLGVGGTIFFTQLDPNNTIAPDGSPSMALVVSDGTQAGTHVLRAPGFGSVGQTALTMVGGRLVFTAFDQTGKEAFFSTDGTVAGTQELALPDGVALAPGNRPYVAALADAAAGIVTLGGGTQQYDAPSGAVVQAGSGHDTVTALAGHVTVTGGAGQLTFFGGAAASTVSGGAGSAVLFGGTGGGSFSGGGAGSSVLVSQGVAGGGNTTLTGAAAGDRLFGSAQGNDVLVGGPGRESILGGGGHASITGGSTAGCVIYTGSGTDTVLGGAAGGDTIVGGSGTLVVAANKGDAIFGGTGALGVEGSASGAADSIVGGAGTLDVNGHGGNMLVVGGSGASSIKTGNGADLVFAGSGGMSLTTGGGASQIVLGSGTLAASEGSGVTLYDMVKGAAVGGAASISGFRAGTDAIDLFGYRQSEVTVAGGAGQTVIQFSDGKQITLLGVAGLGNSISFG